MKRVPAEIVHKAKHYRRRGFSILDISKELKLPKSTIWRFTHDIILGEDILRKIKSRQGGSTRRRLERQLLAQQEAEKIFNKSFLLSMAPLVLSTLYWAEGTKSSFVFTNTDSEMIRLFLFILRKFFNVSNNRIQIMIRLGNSVDSRFILKYWATTTQISKERISVNVNQRYNRTTVKYGLCRITIRRGAQLLKVIKALNHKLTMELLQS